MKSEKIHDISETLKTLEDEGLLNEVSQKHKKLWEEQKSVFGA